RAGGAVSSPPAVPVVVAVHPAEAGATVRSPRDDAIVRERPIGEGRFACDEGPFAAYERTVRTLDDGRVEERVRYRLAIGAWSALFELPLRRALRIRPARTPWWAPPARLDARAAGVLGLLCWLAVVGGYLGTLMTQTVTFAADEFGS